MNDYNLVSLFILKTENGGTVKISIHLWTTSSGNREV